VESAIGEPGVLGLADEVDFGETDGLFVFHTLGEELIVLLLPFERQDLNLAAQAVPDGILREAAFPAAVTGRKTFARCGGSPRVFNHSQPLTVRKRVRSQTEIVCVVGHSYTGLSTDGSSANFLFASHSGPFQKQNRLAVGSPI
jgi:hypothetical protein